MGSSRDMVDEHDMAHMANELRESNLIATADFITMVDQYETSIHMKWLIWSVNHQSDDFLRRLIT